MDIGRPSLRILHLAGGYRAFDLGDPEIRIGPDLQRHMLTIPAQPYNGLFAALESIGFQTIGVDFISGQAQLRMHLPPDFQTFTLTSGFATMWGERAWSGVKNVKSQKTQEILDLSERFATYHRLLTLRIRDLSEAYRNSLLAQMTGIDGKYQVPEDGVLFSSGFQVHIEAALHAFLADAASLRDLIGEATWRLVLQEPSRNVTTFSTFLKKTRDRTSGHPLLADLQKAGADGGWIKILTELRNSVTHIAPLGNTHELHESQIRFQPFRGGSAPVLHYPLTLADGSTRPRPEPIDFDDHTLLEARFRVYLEFVNNSGDALLYASKCADQLIAMAIRVREAAGLTHKIRHTTDADLAGPIHVYPND